MAFKTDPLAGYNTRIRLQLEILVPSNRTPRETLDGIQKFFTFYHPYLDCKLSNLETVGSSVALASEPAPNAPGDPEAEAMARELGVLPTDRPKPAPEPEPEGGLSDTERRRLRRAARKARKAAEAGAPTLSSGLQGAELL